MITNRWEISGTREYHGGVEFYNYKGAWLLRGTEVDTLRINLYSVHSTTFRPGVEVKTVENYIKSYCQYVLDEEPPVRRYDDELWWKTVQKMDSEQRRLAKLLLGLIDSENFELVG